MHQTSTLSQIDMFENKNAILSQHAELPNT